MRTQLFRGHLPAFLHPKPESALVIGLGAGVTLGSILHHPSIRSADCVEISPEVVEASKFFELANDGALTDRRTRLVLEDGRNHLLLTDRKYDLIASEPSNPWMAG